MSYRAYAMDYGEGSRPPILFATFEDAKRRLHVVQSVGYTRAWVSMISSAVEILPFENGYVACERCSTYFPDTVQGSKRCMPCSKEAS